MLAGTPAESIGRGIGRALWYSLLGAVMGVIYGRKKARKKINKTPQTRKSDPRGYASNRASNAQPDDRLLSPNTLSAEKETKEKNKTSASFQQPLTTSKSSDPRTLTRALKTKDTVIDEEHIDDNAPNLLDENKLYAIAWKEIEIKRGDKGLWAKAYSICNGNKEKTRAYYIRERVKELQSKQKERLAKYTEEKKRKDMEKEEKIRVELLEEWIEKKKKLEHIPTNEIRRLLANKGYVHSNANHRDRSGRTYLMNAVMKGDKEAVLLLLLAGVDRDLVSSFGKTASQIAKEKNFAELEHIIEHSKQTTVKPTSVSKRVAAGDTRGVSAKSSIEAISNLHKYDYSKYQGLSHEEIVRRLNRMKYAVQGSLTVNKRDDTDKTCLMRAAEYGDEEAVLLLLTLGADKNLITKRGETAATLARAHKHKRAVQLIEGFEAKMGILHYP